VALGVAQLGFGLDLRLDVAIALIQCWPAVKYPNNRPEKAKEREKAVC
jgi:hypothetical protein